MTLEELKQAERDAYNRHMYHEAAERGYDFRAADAARKEWIRAGEAVKRAEAGAMVESADPDSILGLARQIKQLSEKL